MSPAKSPLSAPVAPTAGLRSERLARLLHAPEIALVALTILTGLACVVLANAFDQQVAWTKFLVSFAPAALLVPVGIYLRARKNAQRLGHFAIASAIYVGFAGVISIFIYLRFPITTTVIDPFLIAADSRLGYSWPSLISSLATYPALGRILSVVYLTSLGQLFLVLLVLSFLNRFDQLHRMMLAGTLSLCIAVGIWWLLPSFGPGAYFTISPEIEAQINLVVDRAYGAEMMHLMRYGSAVITPEHIIGTIAFPSYHTVMALLVVWFLRSTPLLWPALLLNFAMIPAILSHGGHHLIDVIGGVVVFAIALWAAYRIVPHRAPAA